MGFMEQVDVVIAYVTYGWGGAGKTLAYARTNERK